MKWGNYIQLIFMWLIYSVFLYYLKWLDFCFAAKGWLGFGFFVCVFILGSFILAMELDGK